MSATAPLTATPRTATPLERIRILQPRHPNRTHPREPRLYFSIGCERRNHIHKGQASCFEIRKVEVELIDWFSFH